MLQAQKPPLNTARIQRRELRRDDTTTMFKRVAQVHHSSCSTRSSPVPLGRSWEPRSSSSSVLHCCCPSYGGILSTGFGWANGRRGRDGGKENWRDGAPGRTVPAIWPAAGLRGERGVIWSVVAAAEKRKKKFSLRLTEKLCPKRNTTYAL